MEDLLIVGYEDGKGKYGQQIDKPVLIVMKVINNKRYIVGEFFENEAVDIYNKLNMKINDKN